ncbi:MAG: universal stress protein [Salibacteraceae bacterium]
MKNILIAIDFDEHTENFVQFTAQFAQAFDAKLWLIHIASEEPDFLGYHEGPQYIRDMFAKELREDHKKLQAICDKLKATGLNAEGLMIQGPTIQMIIEEAKKLKIDLIITGSQKRSFFYKAFIGSVSEAIVDEANLPVLVVPVGA